jgi:hypothetical protein
MSCLKRKPRRGLSLYSSSRQGTPISIFSNTWVAFCSLFALGFLSQRLFGWEMVVLGIAGAYVTFTLAYIQGLAHGLQRLLLWNDAFQKLTAS